MSRRLGLAAALILLAAGLVPTPARAQSDGDLRPIRDRLAALRARARSGAVGLLPGPDGPGAPPWVVVDPVDVRNHLAAMVLAGEIDAEERSRRASAVRAGFATGLARLDRALADLDARIGSAPVAAADPAPTTTPTRTPPIRTPTPTPPPASPPTAPAAGAVETWTFHLTGVGGTGEAKALSSLSGSLELSIAPDGTATGRVVYDGRSVPDPSVTGTVADRRVLLRFVGPDGTGEAVLTGIVDGSGRHVNGRYRVSSGSAVTLRGSWRAARP